MNTIFSFGYTVFSDSLDRIELSNKVQLLTTMSPNSYGIATKDKLFKRALKESEILVLDGVYFALSSILLQRKNIKKNQGPEVFSHFMDRMNKAHGKVFFLGASEKTLHEMKQKAFTEYPNIQIGHYSPPYKAEFSAEETNQMITAINVFNPDVLFIGMTCPKQEKWGYVNKNQLNVKIICCVGAVFDWYAGNQKSIHPLWWKLRLGWLKRTIDRPEILKRYPNIGIFFWHLFLAIIGIKKYKYGKI